MSLSYRPFAKGRSMKVVAGALRLTALMSASLSALLATGEVSAQTAEPAVPLYIHAGRLLADPLDGHVLTRKTLVVEGGKVVRLEDGFTTAANARVIDLADSFVLPGLIDGHVHLSYRDGRESLMPDSKSPASQAIVGVTTAKLDLLAGFTTVVDLGGENEAVFALRDAANSGALEAPRIIASGDYISSTPMPPPFSHQCSGADECTRVVRDQVTRGADVIKVIATGGVLSTSATGVGLQFTEEELVAIVRTAHSLGRKVMMHAHGTDGINAALRAGADSIEHGSYLDASSIALFKSHGAYLEPTLLAGDTTIDDGGRAPRLSRWRENGVRHGHGRLATRHECAGVSAARQGGRHAHRCHPHGHRVGGGSGRHGGYPRRAQARHGSGSDCREGRSARGHRRAGRRALRDEGRHGLSAVARIGP
jgi:imidazolonepropionase-like amidohydrolase